MDKNFSFTLFDQCTIGTSTQMIKALIPYLEPESQKMLAILVRIRELMLTIQYFTRVPIKKQTFHSNDEMLEQIKKFCSPEMASTIDMMMKFLSMSDMMNVLSGMDGISPENTGMSDIMNLFGMMKTAPPSPDFTQSESESTENAAQSAFPMFNSHQQELFEEYMNTLDTIFEGE